MLHVFKLGFAAFHVQDMQAMTKYYEDTAGLTLTETDENGSAYFSTSTDHHNIVLIPSDRSGIHSFGFQYESEGSREEVIEYLKSQGIQASEAVDGHPVMKDVIAFEDPEGYSVRLFRKTGETKKKGFKSAGIVPNKIGHLSVRVSDAKAQVEFYKKLGFHNTDWIEDFFGFMTCNRDHHVLNFFTSETKGMHHLALEMRNYQHLISTLDFLRLNDVDIVWGPSRHGAGHNIACYHYDPEGNLIELFTDGDVYIKELGIFDPRPWHKDFPQKPKVWKTDECLSLWGVDFEKALV